MIKSENRKINFLIKQKNIFKLTSKIIKSVINYLKLVINHVERYKKRKNISYNNFSKVFATIISLLNIKMD